MAGIEFCSPKSIGWSPNHWYLRMWLHLEIWSFYFYLFLFFYFFYFFIFFIFLFFYFLFFYFFYFLFISTDPFIFNWRIITLQHSVRFCHTSTWISCRYTYVPFFLNLPPTSHLTPPHTTPLGCHRVLVWALESYSKFPLAILHMVQFSSVAQSCLTLRPHGL